MYRKALRLRPATTLGKKWWWFTCKPQYSVFTHNLHFVECALLGEVCLKETAVHSTQAKVPGYNIQQPSKNHQRISLKCSSPKLVNQSLRWWNQVKPVLVKYLRMSTKKPGQDGPGALKDPVASHKGCVPGVSLDVKCIGGKHVSCIRGTSEGLEGLEKARPSIKKALKNGLRLNMKLDPQVHFFTLHFFWEQKKGEISISHRGIFFIFA